MIRKTATTLMVALMVTGSAQAQSIYGAIAEKSAAEAAERARAEDATSSGAETVANAIAAALTHDPQIQLAKADHQSARANRFRAMGGFLPAVEGSGVYTNDNWRSGALDTLNDRDGLTLGLTVRQPVFTGLATVNRYRAARTRVKQSDYSLASANEEVALRAAQAHAALILNRETVAHRKKNKDLVARQLDITRARQRAGAQSRTGVEQARMRLSQAQVALEQARAQLGSAEAAYARIIGYAPPTELMPPQEQDFVAIASEEEAIDSALNANPALNAARQGAKAAKHDKAAARSSFSPDLSVEGNFFRRLDQDLGSVEEDEYQLLARMRVPIFNQGGNIADLRQAASAVESQQAQLTNTRLIITESTAVAWRNMVAAKARREAAKQSVDAAKIAVRGLQMEFEGGRRTVIDVLDGQRDLVDTEISLSQAEFDYRAARYELAALAGTLTASIQE